LKTKQKKHREHSNKNLLLLFFLFNFGLLLPPDFMFLALTISSSISSTALDTVDDEAAANKRFRFSALGAGFVAKSCSICFGFLFFFRQFFFQYSIYE